MAAEDPITVGELSRQFQDFKQYLNTLALQMVTRDLWHAEHQRLIEWVTRVEREYAALEARYEQDKERYEERRRTRTDQDRDQRAADRRLIYGALLTGVVAFLVAVLTRLYGGA